jgi:hypothetical protein
MFGGASGSNPNAAVLAQIQKLSQQIARMQQDMDNRFNQVDAKLNTILNTLDSNFALIDYQLGTLNGDAHAIQVGLLEAQTQLNQLEAYTLAYDQALSKETLINQMNGCLNYRQTYGGDIGQSTYNDCENDFYTWVTNSAEDAIWALQPTPTDYTDAGIYNFFQNSPNQQACPTGCPAPFSVDVNYLAQFPAQNLGLAALSNQGLANPNEFVFGARAYLENAHQWPQYATQVSSSRLDGLIQVGTSLRQAIENANSSNSVGTITANQPLFTALVNKSTAQVTNLQTAIQGIADNFSHNPSIYLQEGPGNAYLDLWGGPSQTTSYVPTAFNSATLTNCPGDLGGGPYTVPANLISLIPSAIRLAGQLQLGTVTVCLGVYTTQIMHRLRPELTSEAAP